MESQEREALLTIALLAAFADGAHEGRERTEIRHNSEWSDPLGARPARR